MLQKHTSHDEDSAEVGVVADEDIRFGFTIHEAERGEDHRQAKSDEAEATDGSYNIETEKVGIFILNGGKETVKLLFLFGRQFETNRLGLLKGLVELEKLLTKIDKIIVEGNGGFGKDIAPLELEIHIVENEAREKAVFGIGDECKNLMRRARKKCREARLGKLNELTVFSPGVGNHFVVKGFAEAIGEVAVIGLEGVGKGVAFSFEDETNATVIVENLVH